MTELNNASGIAYQIESAVTVNAAAEDVGPLIGTAKRAWDRVDSRQYKDRAELRYLVQETHAKLLAALQALESIGRAGTVGEQIPNSKSQTPNENHNGTGAH